MKVLRTFVSPADLTIYHPGDEYPRAGANPAPDTVQRLAADGLIAEDKPEEKTEPKPKRSRKG